MSSTTCSKCGRAVRTFEVGLVHLCADCVIRQAVPSTYETYPPEETPEVLEDGGLEDLTKWGGQ